MIKKSDINESYSIMLEKYEKNQNPKKRLLDEEIEEKVIEILNKLPLNETKIFESIINESIDNKNNKEMLTSKYPSYNEYIKDSEIKKEVCINCLKSNVKFFKTDKIKICEKCFSNLLIKECEKQYSDYIKIVKEKIKKYKKSIDKNNIIMNFYYDFMNRIIVSKVSFSIDEITKNEYPVESLILYLKQRICLYCNNQIKQNDFIIIIPCGCCFCSENCFNKFFKDFDLLTEDTIDLYCLCSHNYLPVELYKLGETLQINNNKKEKEKLIKVFNKVIKEKCAKCNSIFINKTLKQIKYDDPINEGNQYIEKIGDYNNLKHYLCLDCFNSLNDKQKDNNKFICLFCEREHKNISFYN